MTRDVIKIYTDGGCDKNPGGTGGWAVRLQNGEEIVERSGRVEKTTNNRMEMTAAIRALELLDELNWNGRRCPVEIYTDSQYLTRGMNEWIFGWQRRNWTLKDGTPVKNADLWKRLLDLEMKHPVTWIWVQGHAGNPENLRVDHLVQEAIRGKKATEVPRSDLEHPEAVLAPPEVKLIRRRKQPIAVSISQKASTTRRLRIEWAHLQKLIEDLLRVQREGDES
jgi:ribonuclease HI